MTRANLWATFLQTAARFPDRDAFVCGTRRTTFRQWAVRASLWSVWLERLGVGNGDRVLVCLNPSAEMAAVVAAVWSRGAIAAILDPLERGVHVSNAITVVRPTVIVHSTARPLPVTAADRDVFVEDLPEAQAAPSPCPAQGETPASILFTSGSTGRPKGVVQSHRNLLDACRTVARVLRYRGDDRILCPIPWAFDYGFGQFLSTALLGVTHILPEGPSPLGIPAAVEEHRPSVLPGIPSLFGFSLGSLSTFRSADLSCIRTVTTTGAAVPLALLAEMRSAFAGAEIFLNYGLTESYRTTCLPPEQLVARPRSVGKPIPGVELAIVRPDRALAAPGEEGEIVHRGQYLFLGYWGDPQGTAKVLRQDPLFEAGDRRSRRALFTGDYGWLDVEGFLYVRGRRDQLIKSLGVRVSPGEVEELFHDSGLVREVAIFGIPHELLGDEVCCAVVPREARPDNRTVLTQFAHRTMAPYMQPRRYFVHDALPRTPSGKVDYASLIEAARRQDTDLPPNPADRPT